MKSQDLGLLLKLVCMQRRERASSEQSILLDQRYSVRALAFETGISKSQVSLALQRNFEVGLAIRDREFGVPRTNTNGLFEFIAYGLRYVFPAKLGAVTRGVATSLAAPVLKGQLISTGEFTPVWSDAQGDTKGQAVVPLFKSVTYAIRKDDELYALLALVDAVRLGQPRERNLAIKMLEQRMGVAR